MQEKINKQETLEDAYINMCRFKKISNDREYIGLKAAEWGAKWQQEQIGNSEFLQKLRATKSDAEARRLIFEQFKNK